MAAEEEEDNSIATEATVVENPYGKHKQYWLQDSCSRYNSEILSYSGVTAVYLLNWATSSVM